MKIDKNLFFTSDQITSDRNKRNRLIGWIVLYSCITIIFIFFIVNRVSQINTKIIPGGQINLTLPKAQYAVGEDIQLTLTNNLSNTIYFNDQCPQEPLNIYRWENNIWTRVHVTIDSTQCQGSSSSVAIAPGQTYSVDFSKWLSVFNTPGIYRIAALANNYNGLAYVDFNINTPQSASKPTTTTQTIYKNVYVPVYVNPNSGTRTTSPTNTPSPSPSPSPAPTPTPTPTPTPPPRVDN